MNLLGMINGGATAFPPAEGFWLDRKKGNVEVWQRTVLIYSYVRGRDEFRAVIPDIRKFIYKFGRETNQGSIFFEFDGFAYEIEAPFVDA
jgi:hypothetical protein